MNVRRATESEPAELAGLIAAFRVALAELRGRAGRPDEEAAAAELREFEGEEYPIFVAEEASRVVGYLICRVDGRTMWAEQLYVRPECRRRGVGSALYAEAERLAGRLGGRTVYNWVHPDNDAIVALLKARGYDVLNLVELRRPVGDERPGGTIRVGRHEFRY